MSEVMADLTSFRSIVDLWASREDLAADTGASSWVVSKWWQRDNIPSEWWSAVLSTGKAREAGLTADDLAGLAARKREPATLDEART